jgi:hypothetical protein
MRRQKSRRVSQLPLFSPPITTPGWESLPHDIQQQVVSLLVQWLRSLAKGGTQVASREAADE